MFKTYFLNLYVQLILGVFRYDTRFSIESFFVEKINVIRTNNTAVDTYNTIKYLKVIYILQRQVRVQNLYASPRNTE